MEGLHDCSTRRQESEVKIDQADELSEFALESGLWKSAYDLNLLL